MTSLSMREWRLRGGEAASGQSSWNLSSCFSDRKADLHLAPCCVRLSQLSPPRPPRLSLHVPALHQAPPEVSAHLTRLQELHEVQNKALCLSPAPCWGCEASTWRSEWDYSPPPSPFPGGAEAKTPMED